MGFFAKLFAIVSGKSAAGRQAVPPARPRDEGDRIGGPNRPWVCEPPANLPELRKLLLGTLYGHRQDGSMAPGGPDPAALDAMISEMLKMAFLRQLFGEEGKDWECGIRMYLQGSIQTQEIRFKDGRPPLIFYTDFSRFG